VSQRIDAANTQVFRRLGSLAALACAAGWAACSDGPALVDRVALTRRDSDGIERALKLVPVTAAGETRPAVALTDERSVELVANASGLVRFATATTPGNQAFVTVDLARATGKEPARVQVVATDRWQDLLEGIEVRDGDGLTLSLTQPGVVYIGDPTVERHRAEPTVPVVAVVVIDTLRADRTSLDGYPYPTTPRLDALAQDGAAFLRAYVPNPWTRPSTASLLTSLTPQRHGAAGRFDKLPNTVVTWPEVARAAGYQTVAISTNPNVLPFWGFAQGFGRFVDWDTSNWIRRHGDAGAVFARAIEMLDAERLPLFFYIHILDPHGPYRPPIDAARSVHPDFEANEPGFIVDADTPPEVVESASRRYDGEIRHTDTSLGNFIDALRERKLYDSSAIVVVGDHGEEFLEHGGVSHGLTLFEEQVRVPMIIKLPHGEARADAERGNRVDALASILDAMPTLAEQIGWTPPPGIDGKSLRPAIVDGTPVHEQLTATAQLRGNHAHALIGPHQKLIRQLSPAPESIAFDLRKDPGEQSPLADPDLLLALSRELDRELARDSSGWHLRVCGGERPERFAITLAAPVARHRVIDFEPDDRTSTTNEQLKIDVSVGPLQRTADRRGELVEVMTRDSDEVVVPDRERLSIVSLSRESRANLFVGGEASELKAPIEIARSVAVQAAGRTPACPRGASARVEIWFVDALGEAVLEEPDAELRARLEALGYLDAPETPAPETGSAE
jgi:arylsulfatase A-like enzyme